jgi:hypothetical protein
MSLNPHPPTDPPRLRPVTDEPPYDPDYDPPTNGHNRLDGHAPTADRGAEQALLAALLDTPELGPRIRTHLEHDDFYWPVHQHIWDTFHTLTDELPQPPDRTLVLTSLQRAKDADAVRLITDLATFPAVPGLAEAYARTIRDHARLRVIGDLATGLDQIHRQAKVDAIDHYLGEALQRLDDTATRFGPRTNTATGLADLSWLHTGNPPVQEPPAFCRRTDGHALFYAGKVNGIFGDPECGKTWLAQTAIVEALAAGQTAAMIDVDHNGPNHTAARLLLLGARLDQLADPTLFRYYEPQDPDELHAAVADVVRLAPDVVVIDSLGEVFPMLGVSTNDGDEMTTAMRQICSRPAAAGSCVITIDHLPKSAEARSTGYAIGSIAKKRMIRGSYLRAEARQQPTPGGIGRITLRIEKDTAGELRKSSGGGYAGTLTLDSTAEHVTRWTVTHQEMPKNADGTFRPTQLMERVASYIADNENCSSKDIELNVPGKAKWIRDAIQILTTEGFIARTPGARGAWLHSLLIPYREAEDDHA